MDPMSPCSKAKDSLCLNNKAARQERRVGEWTVNLQSFFNFNIIHSVPCASYHSYIRTQAYVHNSVKL